ncbi:hypothetical protein KDA08_05195 [Candidatus Saccharibacteria bacterium]|nr:hypothetical protein [Candidatus Saccharibacteria bacterium]
MFAEIMAAVRNLFDFTSSYWAENPGHSNDEVFDRFKPDMSKLCRDCMNRVDTIDMPCGSTGPWCTASRVKMVSPLQLVTGKVAYKIDTCEEARSKKGKCLPSGQLFVKKEVNNV